MATVLQTSPAGLRNNLASIWRLKRSSVPDASGHVDESLPASWEPATKDKQWVAITPRGSREFFRGQQVAADITHQVEMLFNRDTSAITAKMQIRFSDKFRNRVLNIAEPPRNAFEMNHTLLFACIEVKEGQ